MQQREETGKESRTHLANENTRDNVVKEREKRVTFPAPGAPVSQFAQWHTFCTAPNPIVNYPCDGQEDELGSLLLHQQQSAIAPHNSSSLNRAFFAPEFWKVLLAIKSCLELVSESLKRLFSNGALISLYALA